MFGLTFTNYFLEISIVGVGWAGMVTGQSLVLWSRLHLVLHHKKILRGLLYLIIFDGVLLHCASEGLELAVNAMPDSEPVNVAFGIMERVQLVWFCAQELLLSGLYIRETARMLRMDSGELSRSVLVQLLLVNVVIIVLDLSVVGIQYAGFFTFQVTFKALVYSIKLKLEYVILGRWIRRDLGSDFGFLVKRDGTQLALILQHDLHHVWVCLNSYSPRNLVHMFTLATILLTSIVAFTLPSLDLTTILVPAITFKVYVEGM
ncbi:uncharacterized protein An14g02620 [Aspergillus niger]|uniref:Contig An14c0110, genomic contig n=2 Tax=Aspergillus niger TaxID=5061 RepID=A2R308_ASPNC|nr:uncharacterized protein An14g02620 [Aspergillus niger]CAK46510.1 unnamed protein product [Aspergillus niger]